MITTTDYYKELNAKDEHNEYEAVVLDTIECFKDRVVSYLYNKDMIDDVKKCVTDTVTVDEFDGYYAVYVELNNKARKEYERDNF